MARPRYPSDESRLRRPSGVMVGFSIISPDPNHPEHSEVFGDPELRGIWLGLLAVAGQAFAGRTRDRVTLSLGQLLWVTGRGSRAAGELALSRVCDRMGYGVTPHSGRSWTVHVKNLSRNQGWTTQDSAEDEAESPPLRPPPTPTPIPSPIPIPTEQQREESAPAETAPAAPPPASRAKRTREPKPIPPEAAQFASDFLDGLRARHEGFQGPPTLTAWGREARLMLEVRPLDEARDLARWLFEDPGRDAEFWRRNILGVPKFREQYDRLLVLRRGASYAAPDHIRPGPITQALRNIAARHALRDAN